MMPKISVIIPTLNEESVISDCLRQFEQVSASLEIIVVDGGSEDRTEEIATGCEHVRFLRSPSRGRAVQMNAGAEIATGDLMLFLHADTTLPEDWYRFITASMSTPGISGGRFRFDISDSRRVYRWIVRGTNFRSRRLGITYGDQAIYTSREIFERVGGYEMMPIFEDSKFAERLKQEGTFDWIDVPVVTSARRWQRHGPVRTILLTWFLRVLYILSVSPKTLTRFYGAVR
jgi:rSAM/selenodomain-associated transferase 2